ncbi:Major exported protein [Planctomycetes bacterium Pan216]|uniref:Major exported protein n=1 Tax=Kolteria novifilia TaxID=2527975 RepID=A0A518B3H1_9BACT|nr:Major exported protein [Planctomycetes bacterium Pan216]
MPEIAFCTIEGVEGESNVKDQEGNIDVLQFDHDVSKDVDPLDCSKVRSDRRHSSASFIKYMDKATPVLFQKLVQGETIPSIEIKWYRQPADGSAEPEHYFTHKFESCIITSVRPSMSNALEGGPSGHHECVEFGYRQLTWTSETGGTEFTDEIRT